MISAAKQAPPAPPSPFDGDLGADENILWTGRPGVMAYTLAHMRAVIMALPFIGIALVWNGFVTKNPHLASFGIATWIFIVIALAYLSVPLVANFKSRWFVFYALTNKRLLILQLYPKRKVQAFAIKSVRRVVAKDVSKGVGSMLIDADGAVTKNPIRPHAGFYGIPYVEKLVEAVAVLQNAKEP